MTFLLKRAALAGAVALALTVSLASTPALAQDASQAQDLTNCAGAVAAQANLSVLQPQANASNEWSTALGAILTRMNREPGIEGITGRVAADAARRFWLEQPAAERQASARACQSQFGG